MAPVALVRHRRDHLADLYALLDTLREAIGGARRLADCSGRMAWPQRGVYFFMEDGENRSDSGTGPRIVRVGTHVVTARSQTSLWNRLSQHRGQTKSGGGNHRGSVFRRHVGQALIARRGDGPASWGAGGSAPASVRAAEQELERDVSSVIRAMPFLWLDIDDPPGPDSDRALIERNAIALLSNAGKDPLDPPSRTWLGRDSGNDRIARSGLWNVQHVDADYDPRFLHRLEALIRGMGEDA